jgi:hypothetical protein
MKQISSQYGVEQPKSDNARSPRLRSIQCAAIIMTILLVVVVLPIVVVVANQGKRNDEPRWRDVSPVVSHVNITHTIVTGLWSDVLVIAGTDSTANDPNSNQNGVIELYKYNRISNDASWTKQSQLVTGQDTIIAAMAVSQQGNRIAICAVNPLRFIVYENIDNKSEWKQYGETIHVMELLLNDNTTTTANFDEASITYTPSIMLSDDGRIFAISLSTKSTEGSVHVLIDVNSLGGTIGGVWKRHGAPVQSGQNMDSSFAQYTAMDGSGQKMVVSGNRTMSVYEWSDINNSGNESTWQLTAEYDESPVPESGSIAMSKDGTTIAIGSYKGRDAVDGSGELYILNEVWPWFNYNDEHPWFIENGHDGPDYDHQSAGRVQVSLSKKGDYVLVGRQKLLNDKDHTMSSLQVYHFDTDHTEWTSSGLPFGIQEFATTTFPQQIDISDDGATVATAALGKIFVYKYM